jgi:hypothetical protein
VKRKRKEREKKECPPKKFITASPPEEWEQAHKPMDPKHVVSITDWCTFFNTKVLMMNGGQQVGIYPEFTLFSPNEIKNVLGLYLQNGLNPSPHSKLKFKPQNVDPINGSDPCN